MFNLLISSHGDSWDSSPYEFDRSRVAIEYTADEISERYKFFNEQAIEELKSFPTLFIVEGEQIESKIGYIIDIRLRQNTIVINFEIDPILPTLPIGTIESLKKEIGLGGWELSRTHWAIKDEPLFEILIDKKLISKEQLEASISRRLPTSPSPAVPASTELNNSQVFIVHGHDEIAKLEMADFIKGLDLEPIILHMQASTGRTIIEKIEDYSNVGFGIVLYTPCDIGQKKGELTGNYRARQNVVFEHGFLIGKLSRARVVAVVKDSVETPNDISGVVYVSMDNQANWQAELKKEMRSVGYKV